MDSAERLLPATGVSCVVVDDHEELLGALTATLEGAGHTVVGVASTGEAALRLIDFAQPLVAVLDLELPDMTGIALGGRASWVSPRTSFLLHSARLDGPTVADAFAVGIRGVVLKGTPTRIVEAIATVLDGDVYVDPVLAPAVRRYANGSP